MRLSEKKLIFIAHQFPPCGGTSVRRAIKIVKYLSRYGWQIFVLTPRHGDHSIYRTYWCDEALENEIPKGVKIIRSFTPESLWDSRTGIDFPKPDVAWKETNWKWEFRKHIKSLKRYLLIPEGSVTWIPFAVWRGINLIKQNHINIIYVTAPHFSITLTGGILKFFTKAYLVTEFRDAWTSDPRRPPPMKLHGLFEKWMETWVVRNSDCVICVTEGVRRDFINRYFCLSSPEKKFIIVPNGYDREDKRLFNKPKNTKKRFSMIHTGVLGGERTPKQLMMALAKLFKFQPALSSRIEVLLVGYLGRFEDGLTIHDYIEEFNLSDVVSLTGPVPRVVSLQYQAEADLLLLLFGSIPTDKNPVYGIAGKVFDYMLSETPVLAITDSIAVTQLVKQSGIGEVVNPLDIDGISQAILRAINGEFYFNPQQDYILQFDLKYLCQKLSDILLQVLNMNARLGKDFKIG